MKKHQRHLILLFIISLSILLCEVRYAAALTVKLVVNPNRTEVSAGSDRIALTVRARGTDLAYTWELRGPGKLEGESKGPAVFYLPPKSIEKVSEVAMVTVTVTDGTGQDATETVTFKILAGPTLTPHPTPTSPFSLEDLELLAEYLSDMEEAFLKVSEYEQQDIPAELKILAWERFLQVFSENNSSTTRDNELRNKAEQRIHSWKAEGMPTPTPTFVPPTPTPQPPTPTPRRSEIEQLLRKADTYFNKQWFLTPEETNAFAVYQDVLKLDPANRHAQEKLREMLKTYKNWADASNGKAKYTRTKTFYQRYLTIAQYMISSLGDQSIIQEFREVQKQLQELEVTPIPSPIPTPPPSTPTPSPIPIPRPTPTVREQILFEDDFTDNRNNWFTANYDTLTMKITDGKYVIDNKSGDYQLIWKEISLDQTKDFHIETTMKKVSGGERCAYGILWGAKDNYNFYEFNVLGDGHYSYAKRINNKFYLLLHNRSTYTNKYNRTNKLSIKKSGNIVQFFINDHHITSSLFQNFFGTKIGFVINTNLKVEIDHVIVKYLPGEILTPAPRSPTPTPTPTPLWKTVFEDDFSNNHHNWCIGDEEDGSAKISNGYYIVEHKKETDAWMFFQTVYLDQDKDFVIEGTIQKKEGVNNNGFGLLWGDDGVTGQYRFTISGDGHYQVVKWDKDWIRLIDWTKSAHINKWDSENTLTIKKVGNMLRFFVNDWFIAETPFQSFYGVRIGFVIADKIKIAIDNLKILSKN